MKGPWAYVGELVELHKMTEASERRATWRQSIATLGRGAVEDGPSPLEGLNPDALAKGVAVALSSGLVDDLDWLAPTAAGVALYALAAALPVGAEQRELGRRVVARLHGGNAETFVAMATRMAVGSGKGLANPAARARLELVCDLPFAAGIRDGALALGLASGRELAREWYELPSTGSLQGRRFVARLIERAAREAATRATNGDDHALRVFRSDAMKQAWKRLIEDRESLVSRHVATARGLLAPFVPELEEAIQSGLRNDRGPTEWRRATTSAAAMIAVRPEQGLRLTRTLLQGSIVERNRDIVACVVWGLARAVEAEPEASREALALVAKTAPVEAAEAMVKLRYELVGPNGVVPEVLAPSAEACRRALEMARSDDDGEVALHAEIARELGGIVDGTLRYRVGAALAAYAHSSARVAYVAARDALRELSGNLVALEALTEEAGEGHDEEPASSRAARSARRASLGVLRDIDVSVLERGTLDGLLRLGPTVKTGGSQDDSRALLEELDSMRERLGLWILARERSERHGHPTLRFRRLRTLVHLVDSDVGAQEDVTPRHRKRWTRIASALLHSAAAGPPPAFRRTVLAALARSLDALARADVLDATDILLLAATTFDEPNDFKTLEEASMDVDLVHALERYGAFAGRKTPSSIAPDSMMPSMRAVGPDVMKVRAGLEALEALSKDLFPVSTSRGEALRTAFVRLASSLTAITNARALRHVSAGEPAVVTTLEGALNAVAQLVTGARGRLEPVINTVPPTAIPVDDTPSLAVIVSRAAVPGPSADGLGLELNAWVRSYRDTVPRTLLELVSSCVGKLGTLPADHASMQMHAVRTTPDAVLPAWIPARRSLGGFFVVRSLGAGAAGTVFVVNRLEDRHDENAERFALKVPDYSASAARMLSEAEFLDLFRSEASALLSLPVHPNLARFVTFDTAARPKPILVMELVEGMTLEKIIEARALDLPRAIEIIDDVLKALSAMHAAQLAHLDVKPSNVVLRSSENGVLVDFGLAGRHLRPGCATGPYGAPEVWTAEPGSKLSPIPADIYAFGCLAFETLTGTPLFEAPNETAQIAMHLSHDGFPPRLKEFSMLPGMTAIAQLLFWTLRREPSTRTPVDQIRENLRKIAVDLRDKRWPLA